MAPAQKRQKLDTNGGQVATAIEIADDDIIAPLPRKKDQKDKSQRTQLFVRSLPATTTTQELTEHFSQSYPIKHAVVVTDPATKQCKGYGFVTLTDPEDAQKAQEELDGSLLQGKKIRVEIAESRQRGDERKKTGEDGAAIKPTKPGRPNQDLAPSSTRLIVRNLPWTIGTPEKLEQLFRSYGKINQAIIPKDSAGKMKGFGVIIVRGRKNAEKALEGINGKEVDGRTLAVDWAVNREAWVEAQGIESKDDGDVSVKSEDAEDEDMDMALGGAVQDPDEENHDDDDDDEDEDDDEEEWKTEDEEDKDEIKLEGSAPPQRNHNNTTIFVRNLPFDIIDEDLEEHFSEFGILRYARVVMDRETGRSKGTGFVCFRSQEDMETCLKEAPRNKKGPTIEEKKSDKGAMKSILQDEAVDPSGRYTIEGRILQLSRAVEKTEADRLTAEGTASRFNRDKDKRRLYLLQEGTIGTNSPLYATLSRQDIETREASLKQRKSFVEKNPSLHLSLTRLAIRNIPRSINSKDLKALAREAVVGFATDVKSGKRAALSKEEISRGGDTMTAIEKDRRSAKKGIVKQAKIVFEGREGEKISDESGGAGKSRGYGFVEYHTHRNALMGLRWLNGRAIDYTVEDNTGKKSKAVAAADRLERKKRLIVEFALENAEVMQKRREREERAQGKGNSNKKSMQQSDGGSSKLRKGGKDGESRGGKPFVKKAGKPGEEAGASSKVGDAVDDAEKQKLAKRAQIIGRKRMMRKARRSGGK